MNHKNRDPNQQLQDHDSAIQTLKTIINNVHKNFFFSNCLLSFLINKNHTVFYNIIQYYSFTIQHTKLSSGVASLCIKTSFCVFWNSIHVCFEHFLFQCQNFLSDGRETFVNIAQEFKSVGISGISFFVSRRSTVCFTVFLYLYPRGERRKVRLIFFALSNVAA